MIDKALVFVQEHLNQYLRNRFAVDDDKVVLNNVVSEGGVLPALNHNKMVITLINLELDASAPFQGDETPAADSYAHVSAPISFNLEVLFSSNFDNYEESLKYLAATIEFFQVNPKFNLSTASDLPTDLENLKVEVEQITSERLRDVWSTLGASYRPSVIYKIRQITFPSDQVIREDVSGIATTAGQASVQK